MSKNSLFDNDWKKLASTKDSWVKAVLDNFDNDGSVYLDCLSKWFIALPGSNKQKNGLKAGLRSYDNCAHLGAVNELSWWVYLTSRGFDLERISSGKSSTPDFMLNTDKGKIIFEVTTINPSKNINCHGLQYSQNNSLRKIILKATDDKAKKQQFMYRANQNIPVVLVLFNYDEWSSLGTQFFHKLKDGINDCILPEELSAIIYLERGVLGGKPHYKNESTLVIMNPIAKFRYEMDVINRLSNSEPGWTPCEASRSSET